MKTVQQEVKEIVNKLSIRMDKETVIVPITAICKEFGIDQIAFMKQIRPDSVLAQVIVEYKTVNSSGSIKPIHCIPVNFLFGMLFQVEINDVKPESRSFFKRYKLECMLAISEKIDKDGAPPGFTGFGKGSM